MTLQEIAGQIRAGTIDLGRKHYALGLAHGILQAYHCGYDKITAIEFGVGEGGGFIGLLKAAEYFRQALGMDIRVVGFDVGTGLPDPIPGYKDHPEIWRKGMFRHPDLAGLKAQLPEWADIIIGDINETVPAFNKTFEQGDSKLALVIDDVDFYSSTVATLKIFDMLPTAYVPAVPIYFDDIKWLITLSKYAGMELAIEEFNEQHEIRKIEAKPQFNIENLHVCHIFDHPVRTGEIAPKIPFEIYAKPPGTVHGVIDNNGGYAI